MLFRSRAAKSTGMGHAEVREIDDPMKLGMDCKCGASIHASLEGDHMTMDAKQNDQGVAYGVLSVVASDPEIINSPNGMALM